MIDSYQLIIQNIESGEIFDVSELASQIRYFSDMEGQPGKLSFILEKDPNDILKISVGSIVLFKVVEDKVEKGIFFGYIFTLGTDATEAYEVVAYDQMRYLKNENVLNMENETASTWFNRICNILSIGGNRCSIITPSSYVLPTRLFNKQSYYSMIDWACKETLLKSKDKPFYFIRDVFGVLEFNELENAKTDYIIGDESMLTDYKYELDIDSDTYNKVSIVKVSEKEGKIIRKYAESTVNRIKWGDLGFIKTVGDKMEEKEMQDYANQILLLKNKVKKTMKLNALGIPDLRAGSSFLFRLNKLNIMEWMYITSITHNYDKDFHTMEMEVSII